MVVEKSPTLFIASLQSLIFTLSGVFSLPKASASSTLLEVSLCLDASPFLSNKVDRDTLALKARVAGCEVRKIGIVKCLSLDRQALVNLVRFRVAQTSQRIRSGRKEAPASDKARQRPPGYPYAAWPQLLTA